MSVFMCILKEKTFYIRGRQACSQVLLSHQWNDFLPPNPPQICMYKCTFLYLQVLDTGFVRQKIEDSVREVYSNIEK